MTDKEFTNAIEGTINDVADGIMDRSEAVKNLVKLFTEIATSIAKSKEHLELFIYRVYKMRELQQEFFAGHRNVIAEAKKHEALVDNAIKKLITKFGYDIERIKKKYDQQKLF